jgi:hypothetical protein
MHNHINNLNLTTTLIIGNIIGQNMKITMLCHTMHHCFFYGVLTSTSSALLLYIGLITSKNIPQNVNHMEY